MLSNDTLLAQSNTESSTEECPTKFKCEGADDEGEGCEVEVDHVGVPSRPRDHLLAATGRTEHGANTQGIVSLAGGTTVHFKLDTSTGQLKLKSYAKNTQPTCTLCWRHRNKFYCQECICAGDFVHSRAKFYVRFADQKLSLAGLQRDMQQTKTSIADQVTESVHKKKLREDIRQLKNKIKQMRHVIKWKREKKAIADQNLAKLVTSNTRRQKRLPEYVDKVDKIRMFLERFKQDLSFKRQQCYAMVNLLNQFRTDLVESLSDIFPIDEVYPAVSPDRSDIMLDYLAEAMATSYIHGRWVSVEQSGEMQYRVVMPMLACSGDYSPIYALIATNKDRTIGEDEPSHALNIAAGLSLLAQYLRLISTFVGVPMPMKLKYADFGVIETSEFKFSVKVAKLNLWVVALCLALGVDSREIRPVQTVHNVILLVEHIKSTKLSSSSLPASLTQSDLEQSFTEFGYFEPVAPEMSVSVWEQVIHRENEELRHLEGDGAESSANRDREIWNQDYEKKDWDNDEDSLQEWESVMVEEIYSSSPSDRTLERASATNYGQNHPSSSLSFVTSTVSSLLWGITSPKSPRKK